jgi:hypothetical protein
MAASDTAKSSRSDACDALMIAPTVVASRRSQNQIPPGQYSAFALA